MKLCPFTRRLLFYLHFPRNCGGMAARKKKIDREGEKRSKEGKEMAENAEAGRSSGGKTKALLCRIDRRGGGVSGMPPVTSPRETIPDDWLADSRRQERQERPADRPSDSSCFWNVLKFSSPAKERAPTAPHRVSQ